MTEDEKKKNQEKWLDRAEKFDQMSKSMQQTGNNMMGCGCLLTLLITIPIILFLFIL